MPGDITQTRQIKKQQDWQTNRQGERHTIKEQ